eukprot:m.36815 g.36815  ORF g.36815 m.36815 type:complete len:359 (+) comp11051_c0_seq1:57-1133(+)
MAGREEATTGPVAGAKVWVAHPTDCFRLATVKSVAGAKVTCFDGAYQQYTVDMTDALPANPSRMDGVADNTELMYLHDAALLHNIRHRYANNDIYTTTAYILIAVNPYQKLALYGSAMIKSYAGKPMGQLPPHVYGLADRAFRSLKGSNKNQSIVVSGESGAGKTETCKHVMRFMAEVGGEGPADATGASEVPTGPLEQKILAANPVLEAFGNAKTLRNNNSSRFGKFTGSRTLSATECDVPTNDAPHLWSQLTHSLCFVLLCFVFFFFFFLFSLPFFVAFLFSLLLDRTPFQWRLPPLRSVDRDVPAGKVTTRVTGKGREIVPHFLSAPCRGTACPPKPAATHSAIRLCIFSPERVF